MRTLVLAAIISGPLAAQRTDTVIKNAGAPIHKGVATLTQEIRIGVANGDPNYMFGEIAEVAVARDGSMYIFDRQAPALRKYDVTGKYVKTIGAKGRGPGEYGFGGGLAIHADGRVLFWDANNSRINVYAPDGAVLDQWSTATAASGSSSTQAARSLTADTAGRVFMSRRIYTRVNGVMSARQAWVVFDAKGAVLDTIDVPTFSENPVLSATAPGGNASTSMGVPFAALPTWTRSPVGALITGIPSRYAFEIHEAGKPIVSVRREASATPVSAHERDSARAAVTERMRQTEPAWAWNGPAIPATKPYYKDVIAGDDGRIWLSIVPEVSHRVGSISNMPVTMGPRGSTPPPPRPSLNAPPPATPRPALYAVFEPDGTYLGEVEVPPNVSTVVRRGDYVWAVTYDADDLQFVVRYRINWK